MALIIDSYIDDYGNPTTLTWIPSSDVDSFSPLTQAYGVCFTQEGKVMIIRDKDINKGDWALPGGTVEKGETAEQALHREVMEEADIVLSQVKPLGVQKVEEENHPLIFQSRWVAVISRVQEQTPDPCVGRIIERKLVDFSELYYYVPWGIVHKEVFRLAEEAFNRCKQTGRL